MIEKDRGPWFTTFTGIHFHLFDPHPDEVRLEDIAAHLSVITRFGGALGVPYSVGHHSLLISEIVSPADDMDRFAALMHDSAEAYIGDVVRPFKQSLRKVQDTENRIMEIIAEKYGFEYPLPRVVKLYDKKVTKAEANWAGMDTDAWTDPEYRHVSLTHEEKVKLIEVACLSNLDVRSAFTEKFYKLYKKVNKL